MWKSSRHKIYKVTDLSVADFHNIATYLLVTFYFRKKQTQNTSNGQIKKESEANMK